MNFDVLNLVVRGRVFVFRIAIPPSLRQHYSGRREIRLSLRTTDRTEAIQLVQAQRARVLEDFYRLRAGLPALTQSPVLPRDVKAILNALRQAGLIPCEPVAPETGPSLLDLCTYWEGQAPRRPKTVKAFRAAVKRFLSVHPALTDASKITKAHVVGFRDHPLAQGRNPRTAWKLVSILGTIFICAVNGEKLARNPTQGVRVATAKGPKPRVAFDDDDVRAILATLPADDPPVAWVMRIALCAGLRLAEAVNLRVEDVRKVQGVHVLHVTDEAGAIKNENSNRRVPVHSWLVQQGLLALVEQRLEGRTAFRRAREARRSVLADHGQDREPEEGLAQCPAPLPRLSEGGHGVGGDRGRTHGPR